MKNDDAVRRLKTIEGHIRGIERMLEEGVYCIDVLHQIQAVQSALNKVSTSILDNHLHSCLLNALRGEDPDERERVLREIVDLYEAMKKG